MNVRVAPAAAFTWPDGERPWARGRLIASIAHQRTSRGVEWDRWLHTKAPADLLALLPRATRLHGGHLYWSGRKRDLPLPQYLLSDLKSKIWCANGERKCPAPWTFSLRVSELTQWALTHLPDEGDLLRAAIGPDRELGIALPAATTTGTWSIAPVGQYEALTSPSDLVAIRVERERCAWTLHTPLQERFQTDELAELLHAHGHSALEVLSALTTDNRRAGPGGPPTLNEHLRIAQDILSAAAGN